MVADIKSILIYFSALALTLFFLNFCSKNKPQNALSRLMLILIVALPLSLLAGLKSTSVGTDSYNYAMIFHGIYRDSFWDCIFQSDYEVGFVLIVKILSTLFGKNDGLMFFLLECISLSIFIYSLLKLKDKINPCFCFLLYFFVFYHSSLNIIRQGLAISTVAFMITKLIDKKYFQAFIILLISSSIHFSSIIAVLFILVAMLLKKYQNLSIKRFWYGCIFILLIGAFYFGWNYIISLPIFSSYVDYVDGTYDIGLGVFILGIVYFAPLFLLCRKEIFGDYETEVLFDISFLFIPIAFWGYFAEYATRLNLFPRVALIIFIPFLVKKIRIPLYRRLLTCFYIGLFTFEYIENFLIFNQANAYPYLFNF